MSAAQPPPLLQQQLQQIPQMQQPLLPPDPGDGGGGRAGKTYEASSFLPPHQSPHPSLAAGLQAEPHSSRPTQQLHQHSVGPRQDFVSHQQILYPHPQQQPLPVHPLSNADPHPAGSAGAGGLGRTTTGSSSSSSSSCSVPGRAAAAAASSTGNFPFASSGCNQIQVEPRHVLQLLRQLVDGNPESFKRFQVRPDMPPRAVHQLLRELEEARLIKQQEVLRRAHALALQQQHRDENFESVPLPASTCAPPSLGGASAGPPAGQEIRHTQGGRHNREQQQGQQVAGDIGESERKKKKKKKAVFPEGPGGWGPETTISSNAALAATAAAAETAAAAATAATTAAAPSAAAARSSTSKGTTGNSINVSGFLKVLLTLPPDRQVELLVELLAAPEGLAHVQVLKDTGRLPSALLQQALRKYRQQQRCRTSISSNGGAGRLDESARPQQAGFNTTNTVDARDGTPVREESDICGIGGSSNYYSAARPADPGSYAQRRPSVVHASNQWTCTGDVRAATGAAAAGDLRYMPAPAHGLLSAPREAADDDAAANQEGKAAAQERTKAQFNRDYPEYSAEFTDYASRGGFMQKAHSSTMWLSDAVSDGKTATTTLQIASGPPRLTGKEVTRVSSSFADSGQAANLPSSSDPASTAAAGAAGMKCEDLCSVSCVAGRNLSYGFSKAARAVERKGGEAPAGSGVLMREVQEQNIEAGHNTSAAMREWLEQGRLQQGHQFLRVPDQYLRQATVEESGNPSLASVSDMKFFKGRPGGLISSSQVLMHPAVTVAAEDEVHGEGEVASRKTTLNAPSLVSCPPLYAPFRVASVKDRTDHSALTLVNNGDINGWVQGEAGGRERKTGRGERVEKGRGTLPSDHAALLYFGKGVTVLAAHDRHAATMARKNASFLRLSRLEMHIQRLVDLTVRRLGAAYGGRLFLIDEAEIRALLKQALKDRLRAMAPTLCALAEYRADRHLQQIVTGAREAEQRCTGDEFLVDEAEDAEQSTMLYGSMGRRNDRTNNSNDEASGFPESAEEMLREVETPRQLVCPPRKRSYADTTWQPSLTSHSGGADVSAGVDFYALEWETDDEGLRQRQAKCCRKNLSRRFAVCQRFDELHVLFMQKESDMLLVEHLRKVQEQQRKGKGGGRSKHKNLLATDSSMQSAPFVRNADQGKEGYDSAMSGYKSAVSARGAARIAAVAAVLAYLEKQALLLNSTGVNSDADAQLALISAQLHLELRQHQLSEIAEEKAIEFAKVAHAQRLLLLKATAFDFRTFLHTKTAAAFFPMRFRERLLQYVEALHFDLQIPPPRIPRILLPVASPPLSATGSAVAASALTGAAAKAHGGLVGKISSEKRAATTAISGDNAVHVVHNAGLSTAVSTGSGKSNATLVSGLAACGPLRSSASTVSDAAKYLEAGATGKEAQRAPPTSIRSQTPLEGQGTDTHGTEKTVMDSSALQRNEIAAASNTGVYLATKDVASTVRTARKSGASKTPKVRVRRKISGTILSSGYTDTLQQPLHAGPLVLGSAETPGTVSGAAKMREESGSREGAFKGSTRSTQFNGHPKSPSISNAEGSKPRSDADARSVHPASASIMADNQTLLRPQAEMRNANSSSRAESLAELFGIPTVASTETTTSTAGQISGANVEVKSNNSGKVNNGSRHTDGNLRQTSQSSNSGRRGAVGSKTGDSAQTQQLAEQEPTGLGYANVSSVQCGGQAGHSVAGEFSRNPLHPPQPNLEHRQNSAHVLVPQHENALTAGSARITELPGGFSFTHAFNTVSGTESSSADVVIPELEGEGEEDCL